VLRAVLEKGAHAKAALTERSAGLSPEDGNLLRELVLGVLRWKSALDSELSSVCRVPLSRLAPDLREILEVALYQIRQLDRIPDYAAVDEAVRHARHRGGVRAAKFVNAILRNLQRRGVPPAREEGRAGERTETTSSLACRFSHPEFLVARWIERFGPEEALRILEADNSPSPLDLMANPRRTDRDRLAAALRAEGIETESSPASPLALTVRSGNPLRSPLFAAGHFTVQDVGSQALPLLLPPGETLIDLAAAPGGKSFAAIALGRARRAVALDRSVARLRMLEENRVRLDIFEVEPVAGDALAAPLAPGRFDRVLFDAPCSGTGTLRKNPEIRYRVTPQAIDRLADAQREGLRAAAKLLAPGGYLLYSTCSLEREENEMVVDSTLRADPSLDLVPIEPLDGLGSFVDGARFQMLPGPSTDGFTAHLLRRRG
jgi:16S rRNA (cytosine967-C5)-methyltransferase